MDMDKKRGVFRRKLKNQTAKTVIYRRGDQEYPIMATPTRPIRSNEKELDGIPFGSTLQDFIIETADLPFEPESDDEIRLNGELYRVMPVKVPTGSEQCWRHTSVDRGGMRIHTKLIR